MGWEAAPAAVACNHGTGRPRATANKCTQFAENKLLCRWHYDRLPKSGLHAGGRQKGGGSRLDAKAKSLRGHAARKYGPRGLKKNAAVERRGAQASFA